MVVKSNDGYTCFNQLPYESQESTDLMHNIRALLPLSNEHTGSSLKEIGTPLMRFSCKSAHYLPWFSVHPHLSVQAAMYCKKGRIHPISSKRFTANVHLVWRVQTSQTVRFEYRCAEMRYRAYRRLAVGIPLHFLELHPHSFFPIDGRQERTTAWWSTSRGQGWLTCHHSGVHDVLRICLYLRCRSIYCSRRWESYSRVSLWSSLYY